MMVPDFARARVLVVGDIMLDKYWHGPTRRISPEAPVPVVMVEREEQRLGGAANVALNLAVLGSEVRLLGFLGDDEAGMAVQQLLAEADIHCHALSCAPSPTIAKLRVISRHQQLIRLDFEERLCAYPQQPLLTAFQSLLARVDLIVLSDYAKGTLTQIEPLITAARSAGLPVLIDPKGQDFTRYAGASLLTPNLSEFEAVVGACPDDASLVEKGTGLMQSLALNALLVTRGEQGMTLLQQDAPPMHLNAHAREVYDVTGAGDTVIAVLAAGLSAGESLQQATQIANWAAAIVVGKLGTATVTPQELEQAMQGHPAVERGVTTLAALLPRLVSLRSAGERIVVTNGCFDLLHPGHLQYLAAARNLGDRLIVLVNSDASVRRLKGNSRPINALDFRMTMLAGLACVDWVIAFDEDTPATLIAAILPEVLVKGGDYTDITTIAGHDVVLAHGGRVEVLPFLDGYSSSHLIAKIAGKG